VARLRNVLYGLEILRDGMIDLQAEMQAKAAPWRASRSVRPSLHEVTSRLRSGTGASG
jgi:hypothetical protein